MGVGFKPQKKKRRRIGAGGGSKGSWGWGVRFFSNSLGDSNLGGSNDEDNDDNSI